MIFRGRDVAVLLTTYNRPHLVQDAIASVLEQDCDRWRLYVLDDGCSSEARDAIAYALKIHDPICNATATVRKVCGGVVLEDDRVTWWQGPQRSMAERKSCISYSRSINIALNFLLKDERYICYLCDDDQMYPESIRVRAEFLDQHPDVHVVYGRSRSVQYAKDGFNTWHDGAKPTPGRFCPRPTGERIVNPGGCSARHYFANDGIDPETKLPYVEEAYFVEGLTEYGKPGQIDHNSPMHRRECLATCRQWPRTFAGAGRVEYWGEALSYGVGDAAFLRLLGEVHPFYGIPEWVVTKKYHGLSDGVSSAEVRE